MGCADARLLAYSQKKEEEHALNNNHHLRATAVVWMVADDDDQCDSEKKHIQPHRCSILSFVRRSSIAKRKKMDQRWTDVGRRDARGETTTREMEGAHIAIRRSRRCIIRFVYIYLL